LLCNPWFSRLGGTKTLCSEANEAVLWNKTMYHQFRTNDTFSHAVPLRALPMAFEDVQHLEPPFVEDHAILVRMSAFNAHPLVPSIFDPECHYGKEWVDIYMNLKVIGAGRGRSLLEPASV
jgi:hypothetical protein